MIDKTWGNHCLCEWCCPNMVECMFCICARNLDDMIEICDHDTRLPQAREHLMADVIKELEERIDMFSKEAAAKDNYCLSYRAAGLAEAISLIKNGVDGK